MATSTAPQSDTADGPENSTTSVDARSPGRWGADRGSPLAAGIVTAVERFMLQRTTNHWSHRVD